MPTTLVMTVATLEPSPLGEVFERYHLLRAIPAPITPVLNETGEFEELLASVSAAPSTFGIHFAGQCQENQLCFTDTAGRVRNIPVENLQHALRTTAPDRQPQFFCLSLDSRPPSDAQPIEVATSPWFTHASAALKLHQGGIPQVVALERALSQQPMASLVWDTFYTAIASGHRTRDAIRAARRLLATASTETIAPTRLGITSQHAYEPSPYTWITLIYFHRGIEYPLSLPEPLANPPSLHTASTHATRLPLLGRRKMLHDFRRTRQAQHHVTVVQGAAGIGKTAFCDHALQIYKRLGYTTLNLQCGLA